MFAVLSFVFPGSIRSTPARLSKDRCLKMVVHIQKHIMFRIANELWYNEAVSDRSADWIGQAWRDLKAAQVQRTAGFHEWACFISQQAAEKALKAVLQSLGAEAWGHSVTELLRAVSDRMEVETPLWEAARALDRYYIPARYPNGYAQGKPGDYITEQDSVHATSSAEEIVRFCDGFLA